MSDIKITMKTNKGSMDITLFADDCPVTCARFLNLAKKKFYNSIIFHRVIADFMVQGGDPTGSGMGGPGYKFECECKPHLMHNKAGILSMANAGPNTNGSQFFITHGPTPHLNGKHTVFGEVTNPEGIETVNDIRQNDEILEITVHDSTDELFAAQADRITEWNSKLG